MVQTWRVTYVRDSVVYVDKIREAGGAGGTETKSTIVDFTELSENQLGALTLR